MHYIGMDCHITTLDFVKTVPPPCTARHTRLHDSATRSEGHKKWHTSGLLSDNRYYRFFVCSAKKVPG